MPLFHERTSKMAELRIKNRIEASGSEPEAGGLIINSGGTTFLIGLHFSETSKDTMSDKVKKLAKKAVESGNF